MSDSPTPSLHWDIFCQVIDNYGDIGVTWRLARNLVRQYHQQVRLFVDDLETFRRLRADVATDRAQQQIDGITIVHWQPGLACDPSADVVIEAFACELPTAWLTAMQEAERPPVWINLEYLSAEDWVEDCHLMTSISPATELKKVFFFPGFTDKTGGLIIDRPPPAPAEATDRTEFLAGIGATDLPANALLVSLFCYENPALLSLLEVWQAAARPVVVLVPEGKALHALQQAGIPLSLQQAYRAGSLHLQAIAFLSQDNYDLLLSHCDINIVRGEDSLVRGLLAEKPLIWHIYPQQEDAHLVKLTAFLERHTASAPAAFCDALETLWMAFNRGEDCARAWNNCLQYTEEWRETSHRHARYLTSLGNLTAKLVQFCKKTL